jgi:rod shape-determining protein MreC
MSISAGYKDGVKARMPVICAEGLVGIVSLVCPKNSDVFLVNHVGFKISALVDGVSPAIVGIIRGENSKSLIMTLAPTEVPITTSNRIVTSGFSEEIPRGLQIGRVLSVESKPESGLLRLRVFPAVSPGKLREVVVLR